MKKKIIISCIAIALFIVTTVSIQSFLKNNKVEAKKDNQPSYPVSTYITPEMKKNGDTGGIMAMRMDYNAQTVKAEATDIAVIRVINKKKADMKLSVMIPGTYGDILIDEVISGKNLKKGDVVPYIREGGIITVKEYETTDEPEAIAKRDRLRKEAGDTIDKEKTYYNMYMEDDIIIEEGKTYLAYLTYNERHKLYVIVGWEVGLREIDIAKEDTDVRNLNFDMDKANIKNNKTGAYESLRDYIQTQIKN